MFRLISLLVVVAVIAVLWLTVFNSTVNPACAGRGSTTTLSPELTKSLPKGMANAINC